MFRRKPKNTTDEVVAVEEGIDDVILSDTYNALCLELSKIVTPMRVYTPIGVVLKHQLYDTIPNPTKVEQELNRLRISKKIILLRMNGLQVETVGVVLTESYQLMLQNLLLSPSRSSLSSQQQHYLIESFIKNIPSISDHSDRISFKELAKLFSAETNKDDINSSTTTMLKFLTKHGILLPRRDLEICDGVYDGNNNNRIFQLAIPRLGKFIGTMSRARKEILKNLSRRLPYKEIRYNELVRRKLRSSTLPIEFHVKDLVGSRVLQQQKLSEGDSMLRINKIIL